METAFVLVVLVGFFAVASSPLVVRDWWRWRKARRKWEEFVRKRRLYGRARHTLSRTWTLAGRIDGVDVKAVARTTSTRVEASRRVDPMFTFTSRGFLGARGWKSGDEALDDAVTLSGHPLALAAALDPDTRARVREAVGLGITIAGGEVRFEIDRRLAGGESIEPIVILVAALSKALAEKSEAERVEGAASSAKSDPDQNVRRAALLALAEFAPESPQFQDAARAVRAGIGLNRELLAIGASRHGTVEERRSFVGEVSPEVEALLLRSLAKDAARESEALLLQRLAKAEFPATLAAVEMLGEIGTAAAVAPLHAVQPGLLGDGTLRRAILAAIAKIQARQEGANPGDLTLAESDDARGALSEPVVAGAVSIAKK